MGPKRKRTPKSSDISLTQPASQLSSSASVHSSSVSDTAPDSDDSDEKHDDAGSVILPPAVAQAATGDNDAEDEDPEQKEDDDQDQDDDDTGERQEDRDALIETGETGDQRKLHAVIIAHSVAKIWNEARTEWELQYIYEMPGGECVCGHRITEHCVITNRQVGGETLIVGNRCINQMGGEISKVSTSCFQSFKKLKRNPTDKYANENLIRLALKREIIPKAKGEQYVDSWRRRNTSLPKRRQDEIVEMNRKIIVAFSSPTHICKYCRKPVYARRSKDATDIDEKPYWTCYNYDGHSTDGSMCAVYIDADGHCRLGQDKQKKLRPVDENSTGMCKLCQRAVRAEFSAKKRTWWLGCRNHKPITFDIDRQ